MRPGAANLPTTYVRVLSSHEQTLVALLSLASLRDANVSIRFGVDLS